MVCIYIRIVFTSWYDVSHAMGFRVWGQNSIKNHSLTLLDINLCIKPGLNTFSPPSWQVYLFEVTMYVYLGGGTKATVCRTTWTDWKWRPVAWSVDSKPDKNIPLWSQKWKGNMLQNTRLQRNGRLSPKSDDNMNDSCVKTQTPRIYEVSLSLLQIG